MKCRRQISLVTTAVSEEECGRAAFAGRINLQVTLDISAGFAVAQALGSSEAETPQPCSKTTSTGDFPKLSTQLRSAPASTRRVHTSAEPAAAAMCSGVLPVVLFFADNDADRESSSNAAKE